MTINEAITLCGTLKPNQFESKDLVRWLSDLDGTIKAELIDTHEEETPAEFHGYNDLTAQEWEKTELLVKAPYEDLYLKYLFSQIDFHNAEFGRYNNSSLMFNMAYMAYADYYNRTHMPLQKNRNKV